MKTATSSAEIKTLTTHYIDGSFVESHGREVMDIIKPTNSQVSLGFRSVEGAWRTIEDYEAMHTTRKGQIRWVRKSDPVAQRQFIHIIFGVAA